MTIDRYILHKIWFQVLRQFAKDKYKSVKIRKGLLKNYQWCINAGGNYYPLGIYEPVTSSHIINNLNEGDIFFDLGANTGYLSLLASKQVGRIGAVYSFEPIPRNIDFLNQHVSKNLITNISIERFAISDKVGHVEFTIENNQSANTYVKESLNFKNKETKLLVPTFTLDYLVVEKSKLPPPSVIKIDVEGAEFDVLWGSQNLLKKHKPVLILSTHEKFVSGIDEKCTSFLKSLGYTLEEMDNKISKTYVEGLSDYVAKYGK